MCDFGVLGVLPTVADVQNRVNERFDKLFHYDTRGVRHALVCTFCDEYLMSPDNTSFLPIAELREKRHLFDWAYFSNPMEVAGITGPTKNFVFNDIDRLIEDSKWLEGLCLSPRGVIGKKKDHSRSPTGFSCCNKCKMSIKSNYTPLYAIVNKNYVGYPPDCLKELTELELAFITPVKGYGYCFTWKGGAQKVLRGTMTFMRVEPRKIVEVAAQLDGMGLKKHIVVLLNGKMTSAQKKRASQLIRVEKVIVAVEWLCLHHVRWKDIDFNKYKEEVANYVPTICDLSTEVTSLNENIEKENVFSCFYPDGAVNDRQGGFNNPADFRTYINEMHARGYNIQLQVNLQREFVDGRDGEQLISSCLLQFPYGMGGLREDRIQIDGSVTDEMEIESYMAHLTLLSQPEFKHPMFLLVAYSLCSKLRLLRKSRLQLRHELSVSALANSLHASDVSNAIKARQVGDRTGGTVASRLLLDAVDGMSRALPHSNEAAKSARSKGESMQHQFGIPSVFLTVTFDDENSLVIQVLSGVTIDNDNDMNDLTDDELSNRALQRKDFRLKYPGFGSLNFEILFQVVMEEVVGWNMRRNCATDVPGLFGKCLAAVVAYEEQGRLTVHAHLTIWIENFDSLRYNMFFGATSEKRDAARLISDYFERISTTELIGTGEKKVLQKAFDHSKCSVVMNKRSNPEVVDNQGLRNLRHRLAFTEDGHFAVCPHCAQEFTYENLVGMYCRRVGRIRGDSSISELAANDIGTIPKYRMHAMCIKFQKQVGGTIDRNTRLAVNAAYNSHLSSHVSSCFRCQKKGKKAKHVCGSTKDCECRYRMPDRPRKKACVRYIKDDSKWFEWNGVEKKQPIVEVLPKRVHYDLFQNVSCKAISESKLTCNSNVSIVTDGPIGQYQFKYLLKSTQEDDSAPYSMVEHSIKSLQSRVHQDDRSEAVRVICRAAFAHNKGNVIGASFASFLTRHDSRFYFSHDFQYCPLHDLKKALNGLSLPGILKHGINGGCYFENQALHYLCRPQELNDLSPKDFFENYYIVDTLRKHTKRGEPVMRFISDTGYFKHPSATGNIARGTRQGVSKRPKALFIKVNQWIFPDSAAFKGNILTCHVSEINSAMEKYAQWILLLLHSYRSMQDLSPDVCNNKFPFVLKLRELSNHERMKQTIFNERNQRFLQNIQNCAYNSVRYKVGTDDLQSVTHSFSVRALDTFDMLEVDDEEETNTDEVPYELFLDNCEPADLTDSNADYFSLKLENYSFKPLRNGGIRNCGFSSKIPSISVSQNELLYREWLLYDTSVGRAHTLPTAFPVLNNPKLTDVLRVYLRQSIRKTRPTVFKRNVEVEVCEANGSLNSIFEWANGARLDKKQRRSFEAIVSSFLLTFYDFKDEDYNDAAVSTSHRTRVRNIIKGLKKLLGVSDKTKQLILLLHGPGGSGKSTVIFLVIAYAREYCELLGHPFTIRTIVVTAMSGVAATLIHGETTHMSMGLNRSTVTSEMIEAWSDTRLVIIDECSFASAEDVNKIEQHARDLKNDAFQCYGGMNIVFAGDFSQLEPPCREPLYSCKRQNCVSFHGLLNAFIELDGQHRFKHDSKYGDIMSRFREGTVSTEDIRFINDNCVISPSHVPENNVPVAVYRNRNRDAINAAMFERYCTDNKPTNNTEVFAGAILVLMDNLEIYDSSKTYVSVMSNAVKSYFYSYCGEDACKSCDMTSGRVDPVLKLYPGCPLMLTLNKDVCNGQANGSRVTLQRVTVKNGENPMVITLSCNTKVRVFMASQISAFTLRHEVEDIVPRVFNVLSKSFSFKANVVIFGDKRTVRMKGTQFPVISNGVTTGHKLQGSTLPSLAVLELHYQQNWTYVILSRVTTSKGLFLSEALSLNLDDYAMSRDMKEMISEFQSNIALKFFENEEYDQMLTQDQHNRELRGMVSN